MKFPELIGGLGRAASLAGHAFGLKEIAEQIRDFFDSARDVTKPFVPRGFGEELGFLAVLEATEKTKPGAKEQIFNYMAGHFIPPTHTGLLGQGQYARALQGFMKHVLAIPVKNGNSPRIWLMNLAMRLEHDDADAIFMEHQLLRIPYPPETNFDEHVNNSHRRMLEARRKKGRLHRIVRNWL